MIAENIRDAVEMGLAELPVVQYAWLEIDAIPFSERVREICRQECPRYGTSWSCPPGVGTVEACRRRCEACDGAFVYTTVAEVSDAENMEEALATRRAHEEVTGRIRALFRAAGLETLALSGESCANCENCTYPNAPCRFPERMVPCIEGYGIVVPLLAQRAGIEFMNGRNTVTWFGIVLFTNLPQIHHISVK